MPRLHPVAGTGLGAVQGHHDPRAASAVGEQFPLSRVADAVRAALAAGSAVAFAGDGYPDAAAAKLLKPGAPNRGCANVPVVVGKPSVGAIARFASFDA